MIRVLLMTLVVLGTSARAYAQVDCWAPREEMDAIASPRWAPMRRTLLAIEDMIRRNAAYQAPPEPVRMRTSIMAGPAPESGARIFVRAYPERQTTAGILIWTPGKCDVIPQAERVAASVGQIYVFVNYNVKEQFLGGDEVPKLSGHVAGYPVYNDKIVLTKDGRLPWIPQTLADRLDREAARREREVDDWNKTKASRRLPDEASVQRTYEMFKNTDPAGAEKFLASSRELQAQAKRAIETDKIMDAHLAKLVNELQRYRATFTPAQLAAPAVWADTSGEARARLDARIREFNQLSPADQQRVDDLGRESRALERQAQTEAAKKNAAEAARLREQSNALALQVRAIRQAHQEKAFYLIQEARAEFDLVNLRPGTADKALAFKTDPTFPDYSDPNRVQLLTIVFWAKADRREVTPRGTWLQRAQDTFDFPALAALLK